jgi:hypothetical protein
MASDEKDNPTQGISRRGLLGTSAGQGRNGQPPESSQLARTGKRRAQAVTKFSNRGLSRPRILQAIDDSLHARNRTPNGEHLSTEYVT